LSILLSGELPAVSLRREVPAHYINHSVYSDIAAIFPSGDLMPAVNVLENLYTTYLASNLQLPVNMVLPLRRFQFRAPLFPKISVLNILFLPLKLFKPPLKLKCII
jgi:hypothetical protein